MHSRIFQITTYTKEELEEQYSIAEADSFCGDDSSFVGAVADYVTKDTDRADSLNWLFSILKAKIGEELIVINEKEESIYFKKGAKIKYFEENFLKFKELSKEITLESFSGITDDTNAFTIMELVNSKYGFYVCDEYCGYETFDVFMRYALEEEKIYYIGGTVDYHC
ncbi:MAG: hypothetical protein ACRDBY_11085 [Cetobacterium sp.]